MGKIPQAQGSERRRVIVFKATSGLPVWRRFDHQVEVQVEGQSLLQLSDLVSCHFAFNPAVAPYLPAMPVTSKTDLFITKAWSGNTTSLEVAQPELALLDATQCVLRWCLQSVSHQLCYWLQQSLVKNFQGFQDELPTGIYVFPGN